MRRAGDVRLCAKSLSKCRSVARRRARAPGFGSGLANTGAHESPVTHSPPQPDLQRPLQPAFALPPCWWLWASAVLPPMRRRSAASRRPARMKSSSTACSRSVAGDDSDVPVIVEFNDESNADEARRGKRRPPGQAPRRHARPHDPHVEAHAAPAGRRRRGHARALRPPGRSAARPHHCHHRRAHRASAHGLHRRRHRRGGHRLGRHAQPRRPALRRRHRPARRASSSTSWARPRPPTTTGVTARTWPASSPATATTATAHARAWRPAPPSWR